MIRKLEGRKLMKERNRNGRKREGRDWKAKSRKGVEAKEEDLLRGRNEAIVRLKVTRGEER